MELAFMDSPHFFYIVSAYGFTFVFLALLLGISTAQYLNGKKQIDKK